MGINFNKANRNMILEKYQTLKNQPIDTFFDKYSKLDNPLLKILCTHLQQICSDIEFITSNHKDEQFAIDFCDALNNLSVRI